jgi:hypothetical protein
VIYSVTVIHANRYDKHTPLRPFTTKAWPHYRRMHGFMPRAQPRGTHSFDPGSSSSVSATQALNKVNAENDGEEDQAGPPVDTPMVNIPAAFTLAMSSLFPPPPDTVSLRGTSQSSDAMPPPFSSSISPTTHVSHSQKTHVSLSSALSHTSHTTPSETQTTSSKRKRKHDTTGDMPPPSSKRTSKNKTETMNPIIISSQLNSTLTRLVDVMEKSLDITATSIEAPTTHPAPFPSSSHASSLSIPSQLPGPPSTLSSTSSSDSEVLDKALWIVTADQDFLYEDDLLAASLLFSNTSNEVVRITRTFIALSNTPTVQHRFLVHQLKTAGLRTSMGKRKGRAIENDDDFPMMD